MSLTGRITLLLASVVSLFTLPWLGTWLHHSGSIPDGFFAYPPLSAPDKAPFNLTIFILIAVAFFLVAMVYIMPKWFGFKKVMPPPQEPVPNVNLPIWFWVGLVMWGSAIILLWGKFKEPEWFLHWSDFPLFWGFTLVLDGLVYKRTGDRSIISHYPREIIGIGTISMTGWMMFEFLNFFVEDDWYYPKGDIISEEQFLLYAIIISSGLMPLAFEWFSLFNTFPKLRLRFSNGLRVVLPEWIKTALLILALISMIGAGLFPNYLFFSLWISPLIILSVTLDKIGVWTPFVPIGKGDWSPVLVFALTYLAAGLLLECQNYFSAIHGPGKEVIFTMAPAYWVYSLPYVDSPHLFEMPILGYLGYMPFSLYCWIWWITCATLLHMPSHFYKDDMLHRTDPFE